MITYLEGTIQSIDENAITLLVNSVGYGVIVANVQGYQIGKKISLNVRLTWHQEDGPQLFGFETPQERTIFDLVTSCSGFGPKIGIAVLQAMQPGAFIAAIAQQDIKALSSVSGIGGKKAEVMILQLKSKVGKLIDGGFTDGENTAALGVFKDLSGVLTSLGYSQKEISSATSYAQSETSGNLTFDECLRKALSYLSKKGV